MFAWLPDVNAVRERFELSPRTAEITMLKSLHPRVELLPESLAAAEWFHCADHV
jgi:hypothetical protein